MLLWPRRLLAVFLVLCAPLAAEVRTLTILHVNDLHARLSPLDNHTGGFAYLAAAIRRERANCEDCILLNAGDLVQGSPVSTIFRGTPVYEIGNLLGFDVSILGNHEFDYGWEQTQRFLKIAKYPIVTANVVDAHNQMMTAKPYVILKVNGLRVAVLGIMTDTLADVTSPKSLGEWHSIPAVATARRYAAELKSESDLIVMLAHIAPVEEQKFLASVPEIPVLVTGHAHTGLSELMEQGGRILVRVKGYGAELGRLELKVDTEKKAPVEWHWKHLTVDSNAQPAADVLEQVKHWEGEVTAVVDKPLAVSTKDFTKREVKGLIEQALREETHSDFAWMNMGGVRDTLPKGQLLLRHLWNVMPFDNVVLVGTFKGRDLPAVVVGDRTIEPDRDYTLAVSDFTAANQQTAENLRTSGLQFPKEAGIMRDLLIDWFKKKEVIGN